MIRNLEKLTGSPGRCWALQSKWWNRKSFLSHNINQHPSSPFSMIPTAFLTNLATEFKKNNWFQGFSVQFGVFLGSGGSCRSDSGSAFECSWNVGIWGGRGWNGSRHVHCGRRRRGHQPRRGAQHRTARRRRPHHPGRPRWRNSFHSSLHNIPLKYRF